MSDLYEVLQVRPSAETEVIRAAYRALAQKYHPDFGGTPERMAEINAAWAVLGNAERRAAYDVQGAKSHNRRSTDRKGPSVATGQAANSDRTAGGPSGSGSVIDFGRYAGWTVGSLVNHDPDYLEWLARTPVGRRLTVEIDEALARRAMQTAALRPTQKPAPQRRSIIRPWATSGSAAR